MIESVLSLIVPVARMIDRRDSTKYEREILNLKDKIYHEENKSPNDRDDGIIHDCSTRIMRICETLGNTFEGQKTKT